MYHLYFIFLDGMTFTNNHLESKMIFECCESEQVGIGSIPAVGCTLIKDTSPASVLHLPFSEDHDNDYDKVRKTRRVKRKTHYWKIKNLLNPLYYHQKENCYYISRVQLEWMLIHANYKFPSECSYGNPCLFMYDVWGWKNYRREYLQFLKDLSPLSQDAIDYYTVHGWTLNRKLRQTSTLCDLEAAYTKDLTDVIMSSPTLEHTMVLYRGCDLMYSEGHVEKAFLSMSSLLQVSMSFRNIVWQIRIPKMWFSSKRKVFVHTHIFRRGVLSAHEKEREWILAPGAILGDIREEKQVCQDLRLMTATFLGYEEP